MTTRKRKSKEPISVVPKVEITAPSCGSIRDALRCTEPAGHMGSHKCDDGTTLSLWTHDVEPTAADLDADAAEKKSRFDTTPISSGAYDAETLARLRKATGIGASASEPDTLAEQGCYEDIDAKISASQYNRTGILGTPSLPSLKYIGPKFTGLAVISASCAVLAILGTLWAMYYIIRPKLDIHVTVQPMATLTAPVNPNQYWGVGEEKGFLDSAPASPLPLTPSYKPAPDSRDLSITANEDVWLKITASAMDTSSEHGIEYFPPHIVFQGLVVKGWRGEYSVARLTRLVVRVGKEKALDFKTGDEGIAPVNQYMGSGKLAEYVLDGKDLLAQNGGEK